MTTPSPAARVIGGCFLVPFLLVWVPVTLAFDAVIGYGLFQQCRAFTFTAVPGKVLSSGVVTTPDGDGDDSHQLVVRYRYTANGREFTGDRYRYGMFGTGDESWHRVAAGLPPGTPVTVYHDPFDPAESTLTRGPLGMDLFLANFLVPFNLIGVGLPAMALRRKRPGFDPDDRKVVRLTPGGWELRLGARGGWMGFAVLWGGVAFLSVFALGFTVGLNPPLWVAAIPWAVGLGLGAVAVVGTKREVQAAGDELNRVLTVGRRAVPFDRVRAVEVRERESTNESGPSTFYYKCVVSHADDAGSPAEQQVYEFTDRADADRLAAWLRERIGVGG